MWSFILLSLVAGDDMRYVDNYQGLKYDWSALQRPADEPWRVMSELDIYVDSAYVFNFGTDLTTSCTSDPVSAVEVVELFDGVYASCQVIGRHQISRVKLLDKKDPNKGIQITYEGGDRCILEDSPFMNYPRRTTFKLYCSKEESAWALIPEDEIGVCNVIIEKYTPLGCPTQFATGWNKYVQVVFWVLGSLVGYFIAGMIVNIFRGKTGPEVIPHLEMWEDAFECIYERCRKAQTVKKFTGKGSDEKYETI
jgi:hypothetical protein